MGDFQITMQKLFPVMMCKSHESLTLAQGKDYGTALCGNLLPLAQDIG